MIKYLISCCSEYESDDFVGEQIPEYEYLILKGAEKPILEWSGTLVLGVMFYHNETG